MRAFYCDHFVLPLPATHRFPMAKYRLLRERLVATGVLAPDELREPDAADWRAIRLVHTRDYVRAVATGRLPAAAQRRIGFPWSAELVERSRRSVGGTIAAARGALDEGAAVNLAGGTHHAFADRGEGYCVLNDVAIAATRLRRERLVDRVAVVDCDVHQGNGTAAIFADEPAVFTCSLHGEKNFPFRKERSDLDVVLADGTGDDEYLERLRPALERVLAEHRPELVFYVAGADAYAGDRLGRLAVSIDGMRRRDALVFEMCRAEEVPVAVCMGGGYAPDVDAIVEVHAATVHEARRALVTGPGVPAHSVVEATWP